MAWHAQCLGDRQAGRPLAGIEAEQLRGLGGQIGGRIGQVRQLARLAYSGQTGRRLYLAIRLSAN